MDNLLLNLRREKTQIANIRNERADFKTNLTKIKNIIRKYYQHMYANTFDNLDEQTNTQAQITEACDLKKKNLSRPIQRY